MHRALFLAEGWRTERVFDDLSVDDVFRIAIVQ